MSRDKKFVIQFNVVALTNCLLLVALTLLCGKSNKKIWLFGTIGILIFFTVVGAYVLVRYSKDKKSMDDALKDEKKANGVD